MKSENKNVTPKMAAAFLKVNWSNRTVRPEQVEKIAIDIKEGRWEENGEAIKFDTDGNMIDGQHRCLAIIEANKAVPSLIVTGLKRIAQRTLGAAVGRTFNDELTMRGVPYSAVSAGAAKTCAVYDRFGHWEPRFIRSISIMDQGDAYERNEDAIVAAAKHVSRLYFAHKGRGYLPSTTMMAGHLIYFRRYDLEKADWFIERCYTGLGLKADDPVYLLRRMFNPRDPHRRMGHKLRNAVTIKAFNFTCEGRAVTRLAWRATGPVVEEFPRIGVHALEEPIDDDASTLDD